MRLMHVVVILQQPHHIKGLAMPDSCISPV